jgi:hypothetical protein
MLRSLRSSGACSGVLVPALALALTPDGCMIPARSSNKARANPSEKALCRSGRFQIIFVSALKNKPQIMQMTQIVLGLLRLLWLWLRHLMPLRFMPNHAKSVFSFGAR